MKADRRTAAQATAEKLEAVRQSLQVEYRALTADYVSDTAVALEQAISERGYKRRELEEAAERKERIRFVIELQERKATLNAEITALKDQLAALDREANRRRSRAMTLVAEKAGSILLRDIPSEKEFIEDPRVAFSFWDDHISISERRAFSASSLTILRNAVHAGLLWASTLNAQMNYPRFLMMDNIEDKGMTSERSHNFQRVIVEMSANIEADHQIIFTNSMIAPELNDSDLVIGPAYTFENKTLRLG